MLYKPAAMAKRVHGLADCFGNEVLLGKRVFAVPLYSLFELLKSVCSEYKRELRQVPSYS